MADSTGTTSYAYDARHRQTTKTLPASLGGGSFSYGYDPVSNLTSMTDSASVPGSPLTVNYGYNALNLVTSLQDPSGTTSFAYDANHNRTSTTYPDNTVMSQSYDASQRLATIAGMSGSTTLTSFTYNYAKGGSDTLLPQGYSEVMTSPNNSSVANLTGAFTYDKLNRLTNWTVCCQPNTSTNVHNYSYQYDGNSNRTQITADPVSGYSHSNESDLVFNAAGEISTIQAYDSQGVAQPLTTYTYDTAGNQINNNGDGTGKPLSISYYPTNQTQRISDINQNAETMTWAGAGQAERVQRTWTDQGVNYTASYSYSLLGLSGYSNNGINEPSQTSSVTSWIVRDPYGTPIAQRYSTGQEYYYLFDGQGNVVALEDPGVIQAAWDYCPTGNQADLATVQPTTVGLAEPLRQGAVPFDDPTKMFFAPDGTITPDYSGTPTRVSNAASNNPCLSNGNGTFLGELVNAACLAIIALAHGEVVVPTPEGPAIASAVFATPPPPPSGNGGNSGAEDQQVLSSNRFSTNQSKILNALGVTRQQFRYAVHELKGDIPGNPDVVVDLTNGDVYDPRSAEYLGNIYDELP